MLHKMHESNPRENQLLATRPIAELRDESDMHTLVNERVVRFFAEMLGTTAELRVQTASRTPVEA